MKSFICSAIALFVSIICIGLYLSGPRDDESALMAFNRRRWLSDTAVTFAATGLICLALSDRTTISTQSNRRRTSDDEAPEWMK